MTTRNRIAAWVALALAILLFAPLLSVALVAATVSMRVGEDPTLRSADLLIQTAEAREPYQLPPLPKMIEPDDQYPDCEVKFSDLGDHPERSALGRFDGWNPREAFFVLNADLRARPVRDEDAARARYLATRTSEFSRRFLIGCMDATMLAGFCAAYIERLVEPFAAEGPQGEDEAQIERIRAWNGKTMCAFMRGARLNAIEAQAIESEGSQ